MQSPTLGDVLYAKPAPHVAPEGEWVALVQLAAAGDLLALRELYERSHRLVFTLLVRAAGDRAAAERLTQEVFEDVRRLAGSFSAAKGTVLAWIMNLAQARLPAARRAVRANEEREALQSDLQRLNPAERAAIEEVFFDGMPMRKDARAALRKLARAQDENRCEHAERACAFALGALPRDETAGLVAHLVSCAPCWRELDALRPALGSLHAWPTDVLRPYSSLAPADLPAPAKRQAYPQWESVAPGIEVKILAADREKHVVSMLVRLAPNCEYPPHTHAGVEELHLLKGELWIDDRKLYPGDYNRAEPGTADKRVWTETGCSCVLVTSTRDVLAS